MVSTTAAFVLSCVVAATSGGTISGHITTQSGQAIPGASVYVEQGLGGPISATQADTNGRYQFDNIAPGTGGIVAIAEGYAFGGATVTVASGSEIDDLDITLFPATTLQATVKNFKGDAVAGASLPRFVVFGETKYGVPLESLGPHGYVAPTSDASGRLTLNHVPQGSTIAIKVDHPGYAQEAVDDVDVSAGPVEVQLIEGVRLRGEVLTRADQIPVANAAIEFANASPPHDTAFARTGRDGTFELQLRPGVYSYRAEGPQYKSPAWERVRISGEEPSQWVRLLVSKSGRVEGDVRDAVSSEPIEGARIRLVMAGRTAGVFTTGPGGTFEIEAANGVMDLHLDAAPGYRPPNRSGIRVEVDEGDTLRVPTFWLAPIPDYALTVVNAQGEPARDVALRLLRPQQIGWYTPDAEGVIRVKVNSLPEDGRVIGIVQHREREEGALFALAKGQTTGRVQLLPLGTFTGEVANGRGRDLEGAVVSFYFAENESADPILLYQCRATRDGTFTWSGAVPQVPIRCTAHTPLEDGDESPEPPSGESLTAIVNPGGTKNVGTIVVPDGAKSDTLIGKNMSWRGQALICGAPPDDDGAAVVVYCKADEAPALNETLTKLHGFTQALGVDMALIVEGLYACKDAPFPVMKGTAPGIATTYYVGSGGEVIDECMTMPTIDAIRRLAAGGSS